MPKRPPVSPHRAHDGAQTDPRFIYANKASLELWEANWDQLIGMPSRLSAAEDPETQQVPMCERVGEVWTRRHSRCHCLGWGGNMDPAMLQVDSCALIEWNDGGGLLLVNLVVVSCTAQNRQELLDAAAVSKSGVINNYEVLAPDTTLYDWDK